MGICRRTAACTDSALDTASLTDAPQFVLASTYWSPRSGPYFWEHITASEVRTDLDVVVAHGLRHLRLPLMWPEFQPLSERVRAEPMRRLETVLDAAADRGISIAPVLLPVRVGDDAWVPSWMVLPGTMSSVRSVTGHHITNAATRNPFTDPVAVSAAIRLVREITRAFAGHPAVPYWVLGDRVASAESAGGSNEFLSWLHGLSNAAMGSGLRAPIRYCASVRDLMLSHELDMRRMAQEGVDLDIAVDWSPAWARAGDRVWVSFLTAYASTVMGHPIFVTDVRPCRSKGRTHPGAVDPDTFVSAAHEGGAAGCVSWSLFDFTYELHRAPPFDREPDLLHCGLITGSGGLSTAGGVWRDAGAALQVAPVPSGFPRVDPDTRERDAEGVARDVYETWVT